MHRTEQSIADMGAQEYLEFLLGSITFTEEEIERQERNMSEMRRIRTEQTGVDFSGFETGSGHWPTDSFNETIAAPLINVLPLDVRSRIEDVPIGVLPVPSVNSHAARAPLGDPLIIINAGLMHMLAWYFETLFGLTIVWDALGESKAHDYLHGHYLLMLASFALGGQHRRPMDRLKMPVKILGTSILHAVAAETFILAHEIGHIVAGHLEDAKVRAVQIPFGDRLELDFWQKSQQQEFQADAFAWGMYKQVYQELPLIEELGGSGLLAPLTAFVLYTLVDKNHPTPDRYSKHPPAIDRLEQLLLNDDDINSKERIKRDAEDLVSYARSTPQFPQKVMDEALRLVASWPT